MNLPLLTTPEFETIVPSSKQKIKFRPFLVKEEKILFMALQGGDAKEMTNAVQNIIGACVLEPQFDTSKLSMYDIEYLFLKLRGKSVGESIDLKVRHRDSECDHTTQVSINIDDIAVHFPEDYDDKIQLTDSVGIQLRHPGIKHSTMFDGANAENFDNVLKLICDCVVCIYDDSNVYDSFTQDEIVQFIEGLSQQQFAKIQKFFTDLPKLTHTVEWSCSKCNEQDSVTVEGLSNFFT